MMPAIPPEARPDLDTARTLTLVALILEIVIFFIGLSVLVFFLAASPMMGPGTPFGGAFFPVSVVGVLGIVWILLIYILVYQPLQQNDVDRAVTPALVIGILALLLGGVIPGLLLILAYVKTKDAQTKIVFARQRAQG